MKKSIGVGAALLGVFFGSGHAAAQVDTPAEGQDTYSYEFEDEQLLGTGLGSQPAIVGLGVKAARTPLLRPRAQFVREMLKSVEHL